MYVAVSTCVGALAGGFGPVFGGLVLHASEGVSWHFGRVTLLGWHILFFASLVMRYSCLSLIRRIREPAPAPAVEAAGAS
jgi:MFS family permease